MVDCDDLNSNCGYWATTGKCDTNVDNMIEQCPKSCQFCPIQATKDAKALAG